MMWAKKSDLMFESRSVQNKGRPHIVVIGSIKVMLGVENGRVGIKAIGDGWCACEF